MIDAARECERTGRIDEAIAIYEDLIAENFEGSFPYDRLVVLYRKQKRKDDVVRVLNKAVWVFENVVYKLRADRTRKLERYKRELKEAQAAAVK